MSKSLLCVLTLALPAALVPETHLKSRDHENLGELIAEYYQAKRNSEGIAEALEEVAEEIQKLEKKSKGRPVLSMVEDLEEALYYSREYESSVPKGRLQDEQFEGAFDGTVNYAVHAPKKYRPSNGPLPLLVSLPDAEQTLQDHFETDWMDKDLHDEVVVVVCGLPPDDATWAELEGGIGRVMQVMAKVRDQYAIDIDRVFVAGRGASIPAAMRTAEMFPHLFAGVVARAGDTPEGLSPANFRNLPTFFAGGGANATAFGKAAREADIEGCRLEPKGTVADVAAWIRETTRRSTPDRVTLEPTTPVGRTAYWLEAVGYEPSDRPRLDARIDRDANTIHIDGREVSSVRLYFNDLMVDMSEPIHVVANGSKYELELPRRLQYALDQVYRSGDRGRVYTNTHVFDLPAREQ